MDLKLYYQKLRSIESEIQDEFPVVVSRATPDGGVAGVKSQVSRGLAARLIADDKVALASAKAAQEFLAEQNAAWQAAMADEDLAPPKKLAIRPKSQSPKKS